MAGPIIHPKRRVALADAYLAGGHAYDAVRPGYPRPVVDWILSHLPTDLSAREPRLVDIGAGSGKLTELLARPGLDVLALDPSADMLARMAPGIPTLMASAEATTLTSSSIDVLTYAQVWHWLDAKAAAAEASRILRPGGAAILVWNHLDVSEPWVHRYTRISHAGDVFRPGYVPTLNANFGPPQTFEHAWSQPLTPEQLIELAKTRSYYLTAKPELRHNMLRNLDWYLNDHLGFTAGQTVDLPYRTSAFAAVNVA